ncbi:MAG: hypothetical protein M5U26_23285 [Planctomycetota bacterium]|nr:hypothetical protein [Planctomycetota bacterium]
MKAIVFFAGLLLGIVLGWFGGSRIAKENSRVEVLSGPYSDYFGPARGELSEAMQKLKAGDSNVLMHLEAADAWIEKSQVWTEHYLGNSLQMRAPRVLGQ